MTVGEQRAGRKEFVDPVCEVRPAGMEAYKGMFLRESETASCPDTVLGDTEVLRVVLQDLKALIVLRLVGDAIRIVVSAAGDAVTDVECGQFPFEISRQDPDVLRIDTPAERAARFSSRAEAAFKASGAQDSRWSRREGRRIIEPRCRINPKELVQDCQISVDFISQTIRQRVSSSWQGHGVRFGSRTQGGVDTTRPRSLTRLAWIQGLPAMKTPERPEREGSS